MAGYVVSARKYRPVRFDEVVGQAHVTETLKNAVRTGKVAHAFLFCGPRGVGKTTTARILAKMLNCLNPEADFEPCNRCASCLAFKENSSFNIHELDAASNNSVNDIRQLIEQVRILPQIGKYSIYIIDEVHMLTQQAFNAFLKTLEEPPAHAIFILATTEKHKIIPTVLSRCQIFDFARISAEDISRHLAEIARKENITCDPDVLFYIAKKADGGLRDALSIFDRLVNFCGNHLTREDVFRNLYILDYEHFFKITDHALAGEHQALLLIYDEILKAGFEGQHFINGLADHFRSLLVARDPATASLLDVGESVRQSYLEQAQRCSPEFLLEALNLLTQADLDYPAASSKRFFVEVVLLRLADLKKKIFTPPQSVPRL
ncbi:MAG: DNA polymerase III subunit gamma/tau [Flavobacteriales bacterium]|nr:DNA polymerase III subunit gamma/tau [Flavobacteriales bacterium]MCX7649384.1 DNA polymerase III subunit gamma/tau [Flavobacteriales bacterium]MDW8432743.1 DNA polymerase III subunit gamma/tau [Flavobacteriales bacterium]